MDEMRPAITGVANPPGNNMLRNFGHLMNQYSAYVPNASFLFVLFCFVIVFTSSLLSVVAPPYFGLTNAAYYLRQRY